MKIRMDKVSFLEIPPPTSSSTPVFKVGFYSFKALYNIIRQLHDTPFERSRIILLYKSSLKEASRALRTNMTDSEKLIWAAIRKKKLFDIQFYRQRIVGPYIVDFYGPSANLTIEIDGAQHF